MRLIDIESESFLNEMREKQNVCKDLIYNSDDETKTWTEREHWEGVYGVFVEMALTLKKQPTIDAEPVAHGRWESGGYCSCCGWGWADLVYDKTEQMNHMSYCPHCGARMDLEEQDAQTDQPGK